MSKLELLNYILQLFFVRLTRTITTHTDKNTKRQGWAIMYFIVPFTGWGSPYKWVGKRKLVKHIR